LNSKIVSAELYLMLRSLAGYNFEVVRFYYYLRV